MDLHPINQCLDEARRCFLARRIGGPNLYPLGGPTMTEYVEGSCDSTRAFFEYSKGRGLADCGSSTEWTFDGAALRLSAFRWQDRCAGEWPILYRTRRAVAR